MGLLHVCLVRLASFRFRSPMGQVTVNTVVSDLSVESQLRIARHVAQVKNQLTSQIAVGVQQGVSVPEVSIAVSVATIV